jgi:hypothetical protein
MAIGTVYTIKDDIVISQFDCDYEIAVREYFGTATGSGKYYVARKGIEIPYKTKERNLKDVIRPSEHQV